MEVPSGTGMYWNIWTHYSSLTCWVGGRLQIVPASRRDSTIYVPNNADVERRHQLGTVRILNHGALQFYLILLKSLRILLSLLNFSRNCFLLLSIAVICSHIVLKDCFRKGS
jgi:hypothetical protein